MSGDCVRSGDCVTGAARSVEFFDRSADFCSSIEVEADDAGLDPSNVEGACGGMLCAAGASSGDVAAGSVAVGPEKGVDACVLDVVDVDATGVVVRR